MENIKEIIEELDKEIIRRDKIYITLGEANKFLVNKGIITIKDKFNKSLKKALEEGKIPNSQQSKEKPRRWKIVLSSAAIKNYHKEHGIQYYDRHKKKTIVNKVDFGGLNNRQKSWGIGILVFIALFIYVNYFSNNTDGTYITRPNNIASYSEANLDRAIRYNADNDTNAFMGLMLDGYIFELDSGKEVYAVKSKFGKVKIRFKGGSKEVWVLSKAIKYK